MPAPDRNYVLFKLRPGVPDYEGPKSLDGRRYRAHIRYIGDTWYLDLASSTGLLAVRGVALLPGKELLGSYGYSNVLGELWLVDTTGAGENPNYEEMGSRWELRYYPIG